MMTLPCDTRVFQAVLCMSAAMFCLPSMVSDSAAFEPRHYIPVSLYRLIANPSEFDGENISVIGVIAREDKSGALYASQSDAEHMVAPNAIELLFSDCNSTCDTSPKSSYVILRGEFKMHSQGIMKLTAGWLRVHVMYSEEMWRDETSGH
jgi:hypothetical protein